MMRVSREKNPYARRDASATWEAGTTASGNSQTGNSSSLTRIDSENKT